MVLLTIKGVVMQNKKVTMPTINLITNETSFMISP